MSPRLPTAFGLALVLAACSRPPSVEALLAQAYSDERRFEWQLPNARWSNVATKPKSALDRSPALIQAQALLTQREEPTLQARANLIEGRVDLALTSAELLDRAVAHAVSADRNGPAAGYAAAVEYTTRALAADAHNKHAVFNRALAFARLHLHTRALAEWKRYLALESDAAWRQEANRHIAGLNAQAPAHSGSRLFESEIMDRVARRESGTAAGLNDAWLTDALAEQADSQPLAQLVNANEAGDTAAALALAPRVAYPSAPAHRLRARYELLYAQSRRMEPCVAPAVQLAQEARAKGYYWLALLTDLRQAVCLSMTGPPDIAIAKVRQVEAEAAERKFDWLLARATSFRSNMQILAGDVWSTWDDDRDLLRQSRRHLSIVNYQTAAAQRGWYAAAYEFGLAAATAAAEIPNRVLEASNRSAAASHALAAGLFAEAAREAKAAQATYSQLEDSPLHRRYLASLNVVQAKALLGTNQPNEAIHLLEKAQPNLQTEDDRRDANETLGLAYLALNQPEKARAPLEASLRNSANARARAARRNAYRALARIQLDAGHPAKALQTWLEAHSSTVAPAIVWLALPNGYAAWVHGQHQFLPADRAQLKQQAGELAQAAASPSSHQAKLKANGQRIFEKLVLPLSNWNQPQLTLLPDGELAEIPLNLLVTPQNQWWGANRELTHSARADTAPWTTPQTALAFAVGKGPAHLPPLTDATAEAQQLSQHWPTVIRADSQATAQALRELLPQAELFHFSGHGWATNDLGGVYLADGILTPLTPLRLNRTKLAVLSACFTAAGTNTGLANPDSLVQALLDAGAGTVLASRWAIDSAATRRWMATFYAQLAQRATPAAALEKANKAMRDEHPYYWAAFQIYR